MRADRILVYASEATAHAIKSRLSVESRTGWDEAIQVNSFLRVQPKLLNSEAAFRAQLESDISRAWQQNDVSRVFVEDCSGLNLTALVREGVKIRKCKRATIISELLDFIQRLRLHWDSHSRFEWEKASLKHLHPQAWREQFRILRSDWIAEGILKQLRIVSDAELLDSLALQENELLGLTVGHCCVMDSEPGASSNGVKDLLEHRYTCKVFDLDLSNQPTELEVFDHLYIYEDGLWSGVELVDRLKLLATWPLVRSRDRRVTFRFAATSEAGILAARHFLKRENLTSVNVEIGRLEHYMHLRAGVASLLSMNREAEDSEVRKTIDSAIEPLAFRDDALWLGRSLEAQAFCREVGRQLVQPWIARTKRPQDLERNSEAWALGALGFASLTAFSKSVPKPVLPLLWLNGSVKIGGTNINWEPLFWDSRRTGSPPLSRIARPSVGF